MQFIVPSEDHGPFCSRFANQHRGEQLRLVENGAVAAPQQRLRDLRVEPVDDHEDVLIELEDPRGPICTRVPHLEEIIFEQFDAKSVGTLRLTSAAGHDYTLRFTAPLLEGVLDGEP